MLNSKKLIKVKSTIESKMYVPAGIRTHVLRLSVLIKYKLVAVLNNIDVTFAEMLLK